MTVPHQEEPEMIEEKEKSSSTLDAMSKELMLFATKLQTSQKVSCSNLEEMRPKKTSSLKIVKAQDNVQNTNILKFQKVSSKK